MEQFQEMLDTLFPPVSLDLIKREGRLFEPYTYNEIRACLLEEGYKDYGWANGWKLTDKRPPKVQYVTVYQNYSGSSTLEVNHEFRLMYSVD